MRTVVFLLLASLIISCGMSESEARYKCYLGQIGKYKFDAKNSTVDSTLYDLKNLSDMEITFEKDSTFYANKHVFFLDDTVGKWDAGTCGFESAGMLSFLSSPHKISFGPCRLDDSFFTIQGKFSDRLKTVQRYYFRKMK